MSSQSHGKGIIPGREELSAVWNCCGVSRKTGPGNRPLLLFLSGFDGVALREIKKNSDGREEGWLFQEL